MPNELWHQHAGAMLQLGVWQVPERVLEQCLEWKDQGQKHEWFFINQMCYRFGFCSPFKLLGFTGHQHLGLHVLKRSKTICSFWECVGKWQDVCPRPLDDMPRGCLDGWTALGFGVGILHNIPQSCEIHLWRCWPFCSVCISNSVICLFVGSFSMFAYFWDLLNQYQIPLALETIWPENLSPGSESQVVDDPLLSKNTEATLWLL